MILPFIILGTFVLLFVILVLYLKLTVGHCYSAASLLGKTAIVTGGDSGIGYETALDFAKRGARVVLASFVDSKVGKAAAERITKQTNNGSVFFKHMDLASFKSIKNFVEEIYETETRLDILVNNAGALGLPHDTTEDGLLLLMQTNYFGPFLLTTLLLDLLTRTPKSRIVNVASFVAEYTSILDVTQLNSVPQKGMWRDMSVYSTSKLCVILFTIALAERLKSTSTTAYSVHPGGVSTSIVKNQALWMRILKFLSPLVLKNPRDGAQTSVYCSVSEGIENLSGQHFHDCHVVDRYKTASDPDLPGKLWRATENVLDVKNISRNGPFNRNHIKKSYGQ